MIREPGSKQCYIEIPFGSFHVALPCVIWSAAYDPNFDENFFAVTTQSKT